MSRRDRLHKCLWFRLDRLEEWVLDRPLICDREWPFTVVEAAQRMVCLPLGHIPISQCNNPEHTHCAYCPKALPGRTPR